MRISDWSSDVCSSDLRQTQRRVLRRKAQQAEQLRLSGFVVVVDGEPTLSDLLGSLHAVCVKLGQTLEIGRASCRGRVCQYAKISVVDVSLKKNIATVKCRTTIKRQ